MDYYRDTIIMLFDTGGALRLQNVLTLTLNFNMGEQRLRGIQTWGTIDLGEYRYVPDTSNKKQKQGKKERKSYILKHFLRFAP